MVKILIITSSFFPETGPGAIRSNMIVKSLLKDNSNFITLLTISKNKKEYLLMRDKFKNYKNLKIKKIINYIFFFLKNIFYNLKINNQDIIFATSSRFFTSLLAYILFLKNKKRSKFYLDIRDIFIQNISELYFKRKFILYNPIIKFLTYIEEKIYREANLNIVSPGFSFFIRSKSDKISNFTHGIPEIFYNNYFDKNNNSNQNWSNISNTIVYAGNIGEGQGLHFLIPNFAKLNKKYHIKILGNGNYKNLLLEKLKKLNLKNVEILDQVKQSDLIKIYKEADFLLLNLNDYKVFKFVVPSKIFEYATFNKPILCGAGGITKKFINNNIPHVYFFKPNNANDLSNILGELNKDLFIDRDDFIKKFNYKEIIQNYTNSFIHNVHV